MLKEAKRLIQGCNEVLLDSHILSLPRLNFPNKVYVVLGMKTTATSISSLTVCLFTRK